MVIAFKLKILEIWVIAAGLFLVFDNLGKRQKGTLSAYSVFNKNFEKPIGHELGNPYQKKSFDNPIKKSTRVQGTDGIEEADLPTLYFTKIGRFSNKECYCGSLSKYKKCCYPLDLKFGPNNQARIEDKD